METVISEYQKWKQHGESLRVQARQAMEVRYRDLLTEAMRIAQEYHTDFGVALKPPPAITAFRYKTAAGKAKKAADKTSARAAVTLPVRTADPKIAALEKKLAQTRTKVEAARASGKPTKNLDDRIYEIEDEIRLAALAG
ncbi:MAG: hypothetical protein M3N54_12265 [Acidobacteriota bacterium]|nr:hypothetical protein [Acidobacteriota bacterium]